MQITEQSNTEYKLNFLSKEDLEKKGKVRWGADFHEEVQQTMHDRMIEIHRENYESLIRDRIEGNWESYDAKYADIQSQFDQVREQFGKRENKTLTAIAPSNLCQEICLPTDGLYPTRSNPYIATSRFDTQVVKGPIAGIVMGDLL